MPKPPTGISLRSVLETLLWSGGAVGIAEGVALAWARGGDVAWGGVLLTTVAFGVLIVMVQGGLTYAAMGLLSRLPPLRWMRSPGLRTGASALSAMILLPLLIYYNLRHPGYGLSLYYLGPYALLLLGTAAVALLGGLLCDRLTSRPVLVRTLRRGSRGLGAFVLLASALHWVATDDRTLGEASAAPADAQRRPNAVLISIDTLRPDHLQSYGYGRATDPNIQRHFRDGLRFEEAYAPVPLTRPSHSSMLTGFHAAELGMRWNWERLPDSVHTLPEILREHGYHTAAFVSAAPLFGEDSGLDRGFDVYSDVFNPVLAIDDALASTNVLRLLTRLRLVDVVERKADAVTEDVLAWLERDPPQPFFLFVHYYDPHSRYEPPEDEARAMGLGPSQPRTNRGLTSKAQSGVRSFTAPEKALALALYDAEVLFTDRQVGRLLDALEKEGRLDGAVVVLLADHGETLWERESEGYILDHGRLVEPWELRIPFFVRGPGVPAGVETGRTARTQDLTPTMLSLLGIPPPPGLSGSNLIDGSRPNGERAALCFNAPSDDLPSRLCAKSGDYWYTFEPESGKEQLYGLATAANPEARRNLADQHPEVARELRRLVLEMPEPGRRDTGSLDSVTAERLRALGYVE